MAGDLKLSIGQHSDKGRKETNQDFHGALIPGRPVLGIKGVAIAIADGVSSSAVSAEASEAAVKSFLTDYYCTSDTWPVKTAAQRVIAAANAWLHAQNRRVRYTTDIEKGYVCTLSIMVLKATVAHIFHIGDARIYRLAGASLEQLTEDHRVLVSAQQSYLGRALGVNPDVEIDYRAVPLTAGDVFVMATDGVYEFISPRDVTAALTGHADLDAAAQAIVAAAFANGSPDNLTVQIIRVDEVPDADAADLIGHLTELAPPSLPGPRQILDGYRILRDLHGNSRSHIYLAADEVSGEKVVLKIPAIDRHADAPHLRRLVTEEWIARRIDNAHVLKAPPQSRRRTALYTVFHYIEGQTLAQWMIDHPEPDLETVRGIIEQIAKGLRAFHRLEMLHQDLRPQNIMIDAAGTVTLIDFGSTRVPGVIEALPMAGANEILGTAQYAAPEYFLGETGTTRSDLFSLGVIAYQMLTERLPYGAQVAKTRSRKQQARLAYIPARQANPAIPVWVDEALRKAVHPNPARRYEALSEFLYDLRNPNAAFIAAGPVPLLERNPLRFWQALTFLLACMVIWLAFRSS